MRAILLAAGWGTRLGPDGQGSAKALMRIGQRRAIDWPADAVDTLQELRAIDVIANETNRDALSAWAAARASRGAIRVVGNGIASPAGRRGAVADLADHIATSKIDEDLLVLAADNVFDFSLAGLAECARHTPTVVVFDVGSLQKVKRYASVTLAPGGRVTALVEKDPAPASSLAVTALYGIPRSCLSDLAAYLAADQPPDNLGHLAAWWCGQGCLDAVEASGSWIDIGYPDDLARARRQLG